MQATESHTQQPLRINATETYPLGPLSLLYHLWNTESVRCRFKMDPTSVMREFGLSTAAQSAIKTAGDDMTMENIDGVLSYIRTEVKERAELMW